MIPPGRQETLRYHRDFYAHHQLNAPGSWLHRPSPFVLRSLPRLNPPTPALVVDLGAGVGRHAIPAALALPPGSHVLGVDLLPEAAGLLGANAVAAGVGSTIQPVVADIENFGISAATDLVISCSALEHLSGRAAIERVVREWQGTTKVNGLHCLVIAVDRTEVHPGGVVRAAEVECPLSREEVEGLLRRWYSDWDWLEYSVGGYGVAEDRDGAQYVLNAVCVRLLARRT